MTATTVAMNADHGPWREQRWFSSLVEAACEWASSMEPSDELITFFSKDLLQEVCGSDVGNLVSGECPCSSVQKQGFLNARTR